MIEVRHVSKTFPGQEALHDLELEVRRGEVYGLVGPNGSGKSTFIKVLSGYHEPEPGAEVRFLGDEVRLGEQNAAWRRRLRFIHQDLGIIPTLSTVENLGLGVGYATGRFGQIRWRAERKRARALLQRLGLDFDVDLPVSALAPAQRTSVAVVRAIQDWGSQPGLLVLDEPTTSFPPQETERLFELIRELAAQGSGVLFVSHMLREVLSIADRVGVLRDGRLIATHETEGLDESVLIGLLAGGELDALPAEGERDPQARPVVLKVAGLSGELLADLSFDVHEGEIVGFAGILGSGREEIAELLVGARSRQRGVITLGGQELKAKDPGASAARGLCLVPADRVGQGLLMEHSVEENLTLPYLRPLVRWGMIDRHLERQESATWIGRLNVVPARADNQVMNLSGGNQQKVVLAKWLRTRPRVLVLDEPTQGVDVAAKASIHKLLVEAAHGGMAVLVCTIDAAELAQVCDRVIVVRIDASTKELSGPDITERNILAASLDASIEMTVRGHVLL